MIHLALFLSTTIFVSIFEICYFQRIQPIYYSIDQPNDVKNIALTFDDGPHGTLTPRLLDILKEKNAKATFFVMGIKAEMHPTILARALQEGHEIANHVWDHPVMSKLSFEDVHDQLHRTNIAIYKATNTTPTVMRPPYGNTNKKLNNYIAKTENLTVIMWSLDTRDWTRPSPNDIIKNTVSKIKAGTVILCHDIHPGTIEAMPTLVDNIQKLGYQFITVSDMIKNSLKK